MSGWAVWASLCGSQSNLFKMTISVFDVHPYLSSLFLVNGLSYSWSMKHPWTSSSFLTCLPSLFILLLNSSSHLILGVDKCTLKNLISAFNGWSLYLKFRFLTMAYKIPKALAPDCILDFTSSHFLLHSLQSSQISIWSSFTMTSS